jgi:hypothetical protein
MTGYYSLLRHHANLTRSQANQLFWLPDSWSTYVEEIPINVSVGATTTIITFPGTVDLTGLSTGIAVPGATFVWPNSSYTATADSQLYPRATVFSATTRNSATRNVIAWTQTQITLSGTLPAEFTASSGAIRTVRIETYVPRYSYLLTIRRDSTGAATISCPIFFNRSFSTLDERVFDASIYKNSSGLGQVDVTWTSTPDPLSTEGNYVFDAINGYWYKIVTATINSGAASLILDRTPTTSGSSSTGVMFLPGIVKVFDMKIQ